MPEAELKPVKGDGYYRASEVPQYLSEDFYHRHHIPLSIKFNVLKLILMSYSLKNKALRQKKKKKKLINRVLVLTSKWIIVTFDICARLFLELLPNDLPT